MVKLTQIDDESATRFDQGPSATHAAKETETFSDSEASDSESDIDDDFDIENETLLDRIVALKDVIPPQQRTQIVSAGETFKNILYSGMNKSGNILWTLTSSALLLGVPLSLAILAETQLQEMEKEMSLQQSAQDVLAPGSEEAFKNSEKPATA